MQNGDGQIAFSEFLGMFRDELLDLHEILRYLEMHPRKGAESPAKLAQVCCFSHQAVPRPFCVHLAQYGICT